jgi:hypothetical protein
LLRIEAKIAATKFEWRSSQHIGGRRTFFGFIEKLVEVLYN